MVFIFFYLEEVGLGVGVVYFVDLRQGSGSFNVQGIQGEGGYLGGQLYIEEFVILVVGLSYLDVNNSFRLFEFFIFLFFN